MRTEKHNSPTNPNMQIADLRELRRKTKAIYGDLQRDLEAFQQSNGGFATLPPPEGNKIHVTTTCTALMALSAARLIDKVFPSESRGKAITSVFERVVRYEWKSEGLKKDNPFSSALVLRAAGFLVDAKKIDREKVLAYKHGAKSLETIARDIAASADKDFTEAFSVGGSYPPKPAIVYWYVDGIDLLTINIGAKRWQKMATWAGNEFARQLAYVASDNAALMDPVSMTMAACLCARLQKIMSRHGSTEASAELLPSTVEINQAISLLFNHQTPSGIWPKYFPMFHFRAAGANYCFTFEMLEALVTEMGDVRTFSVDGVLAGFGKAVDWCILNRLRYTSSRTEHYYGWNSGGSVTTLRAGMPESWATATVHWFLHNLDQALSVAIEDALLRRYKVTKPLEPDQSKWTPVADADVRFGSSRSTVKRELKQEFLVPLKALSLNRNLNIETRRSALLFGPPGTAKTTLVRTLAQGLGWPCVEVRPSTFLHRGLENIYVVADEIFDDLMDLTGAVIFFDEMDALVQSRDKPLDATQQFLTTSMLPKLAELHDQGRVVFFVATNYRKTFDEAITRAGRFDLLLFVGPPSWGEKLKGLNKMITSTPLGRELTKGMDKRTTTGVWIAPGVQKTLTSITAIVAS